MQNEVDVSSHTGGLFRRGKLLNRRKYLLKNTDRDVACQSGSHEPRPRAGNRNILEKHSRPLRSTAGVPRNQSHPQVSLINTKPRNYNGNLPSEKVEMVWENEVCLNEQKTTSLQVKNRN